MPPIVRSVLAVAAGFVLIAVLSFGTTALLQKAGVYPPGNDPVRGTGPLLVAMAYVAVYAIAGCWLAAYLAPARPMLHALVLGALGLVFNVLGAVASWGQVPAWYLLVSLALVMPYAWIGGRIRERQLARQGPALATS